MPRWIGWSAFYFPENIGKFNIRNNKETDDIQRHKWDNIGNITLFIERREE